MQMETLTTTTAKQKRQYKKKQKQINELVEQVANIDPQEANKILAEAVAETVAQFSDVVDGPSIDNPINIMEKRKYNKKQKQAPICEICRSKVTIDLN